MNIYSVDYVRVGHMFSREELEKIGTNCVKNNIIIISDEIHCDLTMEDRPHIPIAAINPVKHIITLNLHLPVYAENC